MQVWCIEHDGYNGRGTAYYKVLVKPSKKQIGMLSIRARMNPELSYWATLLDETCSDDEIKKCCSRKRTVERRGLKLKAYTWEDEYAERGYVIYAATAGKARGEVSRRKDIGYTDVQVDRAPWLDKYCGKDIPAAVMLEHEWWVMCPQCGCECALDNDTAVMKNGKAYCIDCNAELTFDGELD